MEDYYGKAQLKGTVSRAIKTTPGGLTVINIEIVTRGRDKEWKTWVPVHCFGTARPVGEYAREHFEKGDMVLVDADVTMSRRGNIKCPHCGQEVDQSRYFDVQLKGTRIKSGDITGDTPDTVSGAEADSYDDGIPY